MEDRVNKTASNKSEEVKAKTDDTVDSEEPGRIKPPYPKQAFFFLANQAFERFSYYGIVSILNKYFKNILGYSQSEAKVFVHMFKAFGFLMAIFGSILADQWLGKFRTILYLSIVYIIGHCLNTLAAFSNIDSLPHTELTFLGLSLIVLGLGVRPIVPALAGDQFQVPEQTLLRQRFFSIFYLCVNIGATIAVAATPVIRDIHCLGPATCYPLAFGLTGGAMVLATLVFLCGRTFYLDQPSDGAVVRAAMVVWEGVKGGCGCRRSPSAGSWLEPAKQKYDSQFVDDVSSLLGRHGLLVLFPTFITFWAVFFQMFSTFQNQADAMKLRLGSLEIPSDQLPVLNGALILLLAPLMDYTIYPLLAKKNILVKPTHRICAGMSLSAVSMAIAAGLDLVITSSQENSVSVAWQVPQYVILSLAEVLFSITCLSWAYQQAPPSLKSVLQALNVAMMALGNYLVMVQTAIYDPEDRAATFFFYCGLQTLSTAAFLVLVKTVFQPQAEMPRDTVDQ